MNHRSFDALGFSPSYSCQPDPELPGDGAGAARSTASAAMAASPQNRSGPAGAPCWPPASSWPTARSGPACSRPAGSAGSTGNLARPGPDQAVAVCDGQAYLIDVTEAVERAAFAAGQAAVVEDAGDLGMGVVVEELADGGDGGGGGSAQLGGVRRDGQGEGGVLA